MNSASVWLKAPFLEITEAQWDNALNINLKGPFFLAQTVAKPMLHQGGGVIINITDVWRSSHGTVMRRTERARPGWFH